MIERTVKFLTFSLIPPNFCDLFAFCHSPSPENKKAALFNITLIRDIRQNGFQNFGYYFI